jgi:4'-phosphopantetheinyl transferase
VTAAMACTNTVQIHRFCLDVRPARLCELWALLSTTERARAQRLRFQHDADRFAAGRGLLREALARWVDEAPSSLRIADGLHGKPYLADHPHVHFNAAGSHGVGLIAIARDVQVGIDVEVAQPGADDFDIARHFFCTVEIDELRSLPAGERQAAFLRCWTRKEAYVKALGQGLQVGLDRFAVTLLPGAPAALRWGARNEDVERWTLVDVSDEAAGITAALCYEGHESVVCQEGTG